MRNAYGLHSIVPGGYWYIHLYILAHMPHTRTAHSQRNDIIILMIYNDNEACQQSRSQHPSILSPGIATAMNTSSFILLSLITHALFLHPTPSTTRTLIQETPIKTWELFFPHP